MTYSERYRCADCGEHHYLDCSIPSETWNQIANEGDALCAKCIDKRLTAAGLTAEARFYFSGDSLTSAAYPEPACACKYCVLRNDEADNCEWAGLNCICDCDRARCIRGDEQLAGVAAGG